MAGGGVTAAWGIYERVSAVERLRCTALKGPIDGGNYSPGTRQEWDTEADS